jgi:DNA-binding MarR family transcriptional regulator
MDRLTHLEAAMESVDRLVAWATEIKRQPITSDGLTVHQAGVLHLCIRMGPIGLDELGRLLGSAPSTVTALVDRLDAKGMVRRVQSAVDRRRFIIEPTSRGRDRYGEIASRSRRFIETLFANWSVDDVDALARLVDRFLDSAQDLQFTNTGAAVRRGPLVAGRGDT